MALLNQAHDGRRPAHAWFLKIDPVWIVGMHLCMCVCPHLRLLITSGVMRRDMDLTQLVKQVYNCYMATVVIIVNGRSLGISTHRRH